MIDHEAAFSLRAVLFRSARSLASSSDLHSAAFAGSRPFVRHAFRSVRTIRRRGATRSPWKRTGEESRVRLAAKALAEHVSHLATVQTCQRCMAVIGTVVNPDQASRHRKQCSRPNGERPVRWARSAQDLHRHTVQPAFVQAIRSSHVCGLTTSDRSATDESRSISSILTSRPACRNQFDST